MQVFSIFTLEKVQVAGPYASFERAAKTLANALNEQAEYAVPTVIGWHIDKHDVPEYTRVYI